MDYFNPFQKPAFPLPPMPQRMQPAAARFDPQQFRQFAITLNDNALSGFVQIARARGISEQDIQQGIQIIKSL